MFLSARKKLTPSNSRTANRLTSQSTQQQPPQQPPFPKLQPQSLQQDQQPQLVCTWFAHTLQSGPSPSPLPRHFHVLSPTATAAGELFLFGGSICGVPSNDLYVISTRDFSTTLLRTSGTIPGPRIGHDAVLTGTSFSIWGGLDLSTNYLPNWCHDWLYDNSLYLLNLGTSVSFMSRPTRAN